MSNGIILSSAVRQNLLALQDTASLMATTQQRLATGKKVNSALDDPSAFFTSQALSTRAGDLQHVLDQIGQAVQTINAANNGITSITQLVQSAKSLAEQATATTAPTSTYSSVDSSSNILSAVNLNGAETSATTTGTANLEATPIAITGKTVTETLGSNTGATFANNAAVTTAFPGGGGNDGTVEVKVTARDGTVKTFDVALNHTNTTTTAGLLANFNTAADTGATTTLAADGVTASYDGSNHLVLTANSTDVSFSISAGGSGSTAPTLAATGLTAGAHNSTDLLGQLTAGQGTTLVISGDGANNSPFTPQTLTFGTGGGQVATLADLNTQLGLAATASGNGFSANATPVTAGLNITGHISITKAAGTFSAVVGGGSVNTLSANAAVLENSPGSVFGTHNSQPTLADLGTLNSVNLSSGGALNFTVNGQSYTVGLLSTDRVDDVITKLTNSAVGAYLTFSKVTDGSGHDHIKIDGKDPSVTVTVNANNSSFALGLTVDNTTNNTPAKTDLLDLLNTKLGGGTAGQGKTLTVQVNGGLGQTITFGTAINQIQTIAQLNTALGALSGVTASVSNAGALDVNVASGNTATSLTIGGTATVSLGLALGTTAGTVLSTTSNSARSSLQSQYNAVLAQIDTMAKDSSFNGTNLLGGDNLKVSFNEDGSSSQTIQGTIINAANLGLNALNGTQFQDNTQLQTIQAATQTAIVTLQTQGSQLGSALTTVQARQSFTSAMISTLQTGSDNLVLADTNQEGANMLALQTRQQLSTTALSLANQANQAVLRLFG